MSDPYGYDDGINDDDFLNIDLDTLTSPRKQPPPPAPPQESSNKRLKTDTRISQPRVDVFPPSSRFSTGVKIKPSPAVVLNVKSEPASQNTPLSPRVVVPTEDATILDSHLTKSLTKTLLKYFGFSNFRPGQLRVLHNLLQHKHDTAVFWATGRGKSLCYQLPALYLQTTVICISPLISLMQDQCNKLNGLLENNTTLATYLGTAQTDPSIERRVLEGEFRLVYLTPEKISSFLPQLAKLHQTHGIALIAVDEAHCVSEWGHDFRPEYRHLRVLRESRGLKEVPIMALTATAVPRVQTDILSSLALDHPKIDLQSFDRENLVLQVERKMAGGYRVALAGFVKELKGKAGRQGHSTDHATIIYAPTRRLVEEITAHLQMELRETSMRVSSYHAGLSTVARHESHIDFLVGRTTVIVATVAFGMGIDKPDTRRVLHYGSPKTMEEYYQQIGRAGRDGLPSKCTLWANDADFAKYQNDFYLGPNLAPEAKEAALRSLRELQNYTMDTVTCRRAALLTFFNETPKFGKFCGTCDNCVNRETNKDDLERNFANEARVVLLAVNALKGQALGVMAKVMQGKIVETYRYNRGVRAEHVQGQIASTRENITRKHPISFFNEMVPPLIQRGFLSQRVEKSSHGSSYQSTWTVYDITSKGQNVVQSSQGSTGSQVMLPVPSALRALEEEAARKQAELLSKLEKTGVDIKSIPKKELDAGDGEVLRAHKRWVNHLESLRNAGKVDRLEQLEDLKSRIENWRLESAALYKMAPSTVMPEHLLVKVAYSTASSPTPIEAASLHASGVRSSGVEDLTRILAEWCKETNSVSAAGRTSNDNVKMTFPEGDNAFTPAQQWHLAEYKPNKKTGVASWESSYTRFVDGEHPQTIAINSKSGKPIQVNTVIGHILEGLALGRPVPLARLANVSTPPNQSEWDELANVETSNAEMDVVKSKVPMAEYLRPIMGDMFIDTPYDERDEEDVLKYRNWCHLLKWYQSLRRADYIPVFGE